MSEAHPQSDKEQFQEYVLSLFFDLPSDELKRLRAVFEEVKGCRDIPSAVNKAERILRENGQ